MVVLYLIFYIVLNHMPFGRYVYSLGGNEEAARLSGLRVKYYKLLVYVISGFTASFAGLIFTSRVMSGQPNAGVGFELDAIAAVVLGGIHCRRPRNDYRHPDWRHDARRTE